MDIYGNEQHNRHFRKKREPCMVEVSNFKTNEALCLPPISNRALSTGKDTLSPKISAKI